jgi:hypothetical protein
MHEGQLVDRRMPAFYVLQRHEQRGLGPQRRRDRPQPPDMLAVLPPGIMPPTVGVRDERD